MDPVRSNPSPEDLQHDPVLQELVRRLVAAYDPEAIYLFGSRARGEAGPDSDYDLLVIVRDDAPPDRRRSRLAYEALRGTRTAADVAVTTRADFDFRKVVPMSLAGIATREGQLVHVAPPGVRR